MPSPLLPWELIERVIGHSGDDFETLRSFSLTCRDLHPHALCVLVADFHFKSRDQIFDFCDFLQAHPHLKPLVCSIAVEPGNFSPFPLLNILPNLSKLKFCPTPPRKIMRRSRYKEVITVLNRSTVTCCKPLGTNIQALHLSQLYFPTFLDFSRLLLTFSNLTDLCCSGVAVGAKGTQAHIDGMKRRLSNQLHLSTLEIDFLDIDVAKDNKLSVATVFLDALAVHSTVETLIVHRPNKLCDVLHPSTWPQLRTVVLKLECSHFSVPDAIAALKDFPLSTLKDITVELHCSSIREVHFRILHEPSLGLELEQTLLRFPRPNVTIRMDYLRLGRSSFWTQEIGKHYFPVLFQRGAFKVTCETVISGAGHDDSVQVVATSPDGKRVATASNDSTIIIWDATSGTVLQEWAAHGYEQVTPLAFSPDSRFLLSGGNDSNLRIWDIAQGSRGVTTLTGHSVTSCAWSPHGHTIASGSDDGTVRLWDSRTFRELCVLEHPDRGDIRFIAFSSDGHWLASGSYDSCNVWNISGTPHKSLQAKLAFKLDGYPAVFAFSPGSTRLLVAAYRGVKLVDVETGEELAVLGGLRDTRDVAFSPDGTLFLTASHDGMVILWNADTGVEKLTLEGHKMAFNRACFSPCGKYVASGSDDCTVRLWRTKDGSRVATFSNGNSTQCVAFCADGETLWSGELDGTVVMRRMRDIVLSNEQAY